MTFSPGTRLGAYEILGPLGAGGMGEVYRARDSRLKREVALKALPEEFSKDADRLSRFQREAEVLASLNHRHIATIYGIEEAGGSQFLILELVEGATLADRLAQGPMPLSEAVATATQIADALEAAHERGIVHRDLKPANIKLTPDHVAKVLDFGLAKVQGTDGLDSGLSNSPTLTVSAPGMLMGTAAYMSPEQAGGKLTDRTSDVWAFGCVLHEMLTGRPAFAGDSVGEVLGAVFKSEPDWQRLPAETPESVRRLLHRCLQKDRKHRLHDIADARIELEDAQAEATVDSRRPTGASRRTERLAWVSGVTLLALAAAGLGAFAFRSTPAPPEMRLEINTPGAVNPLGFAISPDGRKIVFVARSESRPFLWLRSLDSGSARPLPQTEDASGPFWSPDSRSVGFFANGKVKRIDIEGEATSVLATSTANLGGTWNRDGVILFSPTPNSPIFRVSSAGGEPLLATRFEPGHSSHRAPQFLPDGRHFLYCSEGSLPGIYIGHLDKTDAKRVVDAEAAAYAPGGQLLFVRQRKMFAQSFDSARLELAGNPYSVDEPIYSDRCQAAISTSATGSLLYRSGPLVGRRQFVWFDRSGKEVGTIGEADNENPQALSMSPDGRYIALNRTVNGFQSLWLIETARGILNRLSVTSAISSFPVWSPDSRRVAFNSSPNGVLDLYQVPVDGSVGEELLLATALPKGPNDWSPDGRFLLYRSPDPKTGFDIWALPLDGNMKPFPVVQTNFDERDAQFSPDGKWIAFESNESGQYEIYVQPFPGRGGKTRVSRAGGAQVRWRRDGSELFYIGLDDRLMAVAVRFSLEDRAVQTGDPVPLFPTRVGGAVQPRFRQQYLVSQDGQPVPDEQLCGRAHLDDEADRELEAEAAGMTLRQQSQKWKVEK